MRSFRAMSVVVVSLVGRLAWASSPFSTFTVPTSVEMLPDDATATRVVIHGGFTFLKAMGTFMYSEPRCGVMYFQCRAGQEAMCRMQWSEIRAASKSLCTGFGAYDMATTATLRSEGAPLGTPDTWDLGMGVTSASFLDGSCPKMIALKCAGSPAKDGGAPDAMTPSHEDAGKPDAKVVVATPDAAVVVTQDAATPPIAVDASPSPGMDAAVVAVDAPAALPPPTKTGSGGCSVVSTGGAPAGLIVALLALAGGMGARRRGRRG